MKYGRDMTNSELRDYEPTRLLGGVDNQKRMILREYSAQVPCPNCATPQNYFEARGVDIDDFEFGHPASDEQCHCVACKRELRLVVPLVKINPPHWEWHLVPIEVPHGAS